MTLQEQLQALPPMEAAAIIAAAASPRAPSTDAALRAEMDILRAENLALKKRKTQDGLKVSEKTGCLSIYGYGKFPINVYAQSMLEILGRADEIRKFIELNKHNLSWKNKTK